MSDDTRRVLELLAQGKVTVEEAQQLLAALKEPTAAASEAAPKTEGTPKARFMRIHVHKHAKDGGKDKDVNIRIPMTVVRGGLRLGTMIPGFHSSMNAKLRESGVNIDLGKIDPAAIESLLAEMGEIHIDNQNGETVRITCE